MAAWRGELSTLSPYTRTISPSEPLIRLTHETLALGKGILAPLGTIYVVEKEGE